MGVSLMKTSIRRRMLDQILSMLIEGENGAAAPAAKRQMAIKRGIAHGLLSFAMERGTYAKVKVLLVSKDIAAWIDVPDVVEDRAERQRTDPELGRPDLQ